MRLKKRLLPFSGRLHARIRKTRYMHKMRCLLINRRSLLLALRLLWKTPIFQSNSRFQRLCAKCLLKLKRLVSILPMTKSNFFFQAEDGIRAADVTGVQTCALPILKPPMMLSWRPTEPPSAETAFSAALPAPGSSRTMTDARSATDAEGVAAFAVAGPARPATTRSEERRVGKEWRCRRAAEAA